MRRDLVGEGNDGRVAAHDGCRRPHDVVGVGRDGPDRRKIGFETDTGELVETDRLIEVAEPKPPQGMQFKSVVVGQGGDGVRSHEHLSTVTGCHHPGGLVNCERDVVVVVRRGQTRLQADTHPDFDVIEPDLCCERALRRQACSDSVAGVRECHEEGVCFHGHLPAAMLRPDSPENVTVTLQDFDVSIPEPIQQARRTLDVGEHERDDTARKLDRRGIHGSSVPHGWPTRPRNIPSGLRTGVGM